MLFTMKIDKIRIKGFRNFQDEEITLQKKTLIIGANDVGKTNFLYALRILFDKSITDQDLELAPSDYNAYVNADRIEITVTLVDITEDFLLSTFRGYVKDGITLIRYTNQKDGTYKFYQGYNEETLQHTEFETRQYIKRLNMQYVDTNRDLMSFLRREKAQLLQAAKERREPEAVIKDNEYISGIQSDLDKIHEKISSLDYVSSALNDVNTELSSLSINNGDQSVKFIAGNTDASKLLENLSLTYSSEDAPLTIGGDGRNNQIFIATWVTRQNSRKNENQVTFYAIEEPEAHLHPHQQKRLSEYIQDKLDSQVFVTSHSPHIASKFDPGNIVRLYSKNKLTYAACGGCNKSLKKVLHDFGYRLNPISSETFFSDGVFLVEGTSEVIFYTALAHENNLDLNWYNISILSVEGIGFMPYIAVCNALDIPWVARTDNDIFLKPKSNPSVKHYAGISRTMNIISLICDSNNTLVQYWALHKTENEWPSSGPIPENAKMLNRYIRKEAQKYGMFISEIDLENDLASSELKDALLKYYDKNRKDSLVKAMQTKKAENMFGFVSENCNKLQNANKTGLILPLLRLSDMITERVHPHGD